MKITCKSTARLAVVAGLCLAATGAPTFAPEAWAESVPAAQQASAKEYEKDTEFTHNGVTYKVLGVYGEDFNESDAESLGFDKGDIAIEILKVDPSAVEGGIHELGSWVQINGQDGHLVNLYVYQVADGAFEESGVQHIFPSGRFHMGSAALPSGADVIVPESRVETYSKLFEGIDIQGYSLTFDDDNLVFPDGIGSNPVELDIESKKTDDMSIEVSVDNSEVISITKGAGDTYTATPLKCGDVHITVNLMLGDRQLESKRAMFIEVPHVEDEWVTEREPTYTTPGTKVLNCKHCGARMKTESIPAVGVTFQTGGIAYRQTAADEVEVVANQELYAGKDIVVPAAVENEGKTYRVTQVGAEAFGDITAGTITLSEGIESIGYFAFFRTKAENIVIPKSVTSVGQEAFAEAKVGTLTFAERQGSAITFGYECFSDYSCDSKRLELPEGTTSLGEKVFGWSEKDVLVDTIVIPSTVMITSRRVLDDIPFGKLELPDSFKIIDNVLYQDGLALFAMDKDATSVTLVPGTKGIADWAFERMKNLVAIDIPDSLESVGISPFTDCPKLESLALPEGVTSLPDRPNAERWLSGCEALKSFSAPGLKNLPPRMFSGCGQLETVALPSVEGIGSIAFSETPALKTIVLPSVKSIDTLAFGSDKTEKTVIFTSDEPPALEEGALREGVTVWYPESAAEAYEKALGITPDLSAPESAFALEVTGELALTEGGAAAALPVTAVKSDEMTLAYAVADDEVATVAEDGAVTPQKAGTTAATVSLMLGDIVLESVEVPVTVGHAFGDAWQSDATGHWHVCGVCQVKGEVSGHEFGAWVTTKEPTAAEDGAVERACPVCGYKETKVLPALGEEPEGPDTENPDTEKPDTEKPNSDDSGAKPSGKPDDAGANDGGEKLVATGDDSGLLSAGVASLGAAALAGAYALRRRKDDLA